MGATVWVLVALTISGHGYQSVVPTLEFTTEQKCRAAVVAFEQDSYGKQGTSRMRCVRIEK